jgi:hypothetical protein
LVNQNWWDAGAQSVTVFLQPKNQFRKAMSSCFQVKGFYMEVERIHFNAEHLTYIFQPVILQKQVNDFQFSFSKMV